MEKQQYISARLGRTGIHLPCATWQALQDKVSVVLRLHQCTIGTAAIDDDHFMSGIAQCR